METKITPIRNKRTALVLSGQCVACGCCTQKCPRLAIEIKGGVSAYVDSTQCVGCGICKKVCPASVIELLEVTA